MTIIINCIGVQCLEAIRRAHCAGRDPHKHAISAILHSCKHPESHALIPEDARRGPSPALIALDALMALNSQGLIATLPMQIGDACSLVKLQTHVHLPQATHFTEVYKQAQEQAAPQLS